MMVSSKCVLQADGLHCTQSDDKGERGSKSARWAIASQSDDNDEKRAVQQGSMKHAKFLALLFIYDKADDDDDDVDVGRARLYHQAAKRARHRLQPVHTDDDDDDGSPCVPSQAN